MSQPLPLWPGARPCVNSGFCCKQRPCPFGKWNEDETQCAFLEPIAVPEGRTQRYTCGIAAEIMTKPGWEVAPAFGAGCCAAVGNTDRMAILNELKLLKGAG